MPLHSRVRIGIRNAPIHDLPNWIVRARQAPRTGGALLDRQLAPRVATELARRGGHIKLPDLLACPRVVRGDETELALPLLARAVRDHLAVGNQESTGSHLSLVDLRLPAELPRLGVERDQESVGRAEINHVLVDAEALRAGSGRQDAARIVALIL